MRTRLASWRWQLIPALAVLLLVGMSAVPASAQYNYGYPYGNNYYGSSYGYNSYPYNYGYNSYNSYPYSSYGYNSYPYNYGSYNSYPYNYYGSSSYPYNYNYYGSSSYPYNYYGSSSYPYNYNYYGSSSYPYNYYGSSYPYNTSSCSNYTAYNCGYNYYGGTGYYPYNYYGNTCGYPYTTYNQYCGYTTTTGTLSAPTGLVVTSVAAGSATVSWGAVAGAVSYIVMQSTNGSGYAPVAYPTVNTATITGLVAGTAYSFEVIAVGTNGVQSPASVPVSTTGTGTGGGTTAIGAPTNLQVVAKTGSSVTLTWTQVTGAASYRIYQAVTNGSFALIPGSINSNAVTITGLNPNTTYIFEVASVDAVGNVSTPSAPATVTTNPS